jgi:hypothetical protein
VSAPVGDASKSGTGDGVGFRVEVGVGF